MISQYKNIERLRYRISNDIADASKTTDSVLTRAGETVFSTVFSYYLSSFSLNDVENVSGLQDWLLLLALRIIIFIVFFVVSFLMIRMLIIGYRAVKIVRRKKKIGIADKKRATKDFDNIALDSLMLVEEYIAIYLDKSKPQRDEIKLFYLYEIVHYTLTSCRFALPLIEKSCITCIGEEKSYYVEEYRFKNYLNILNNQIELFLKSSNIQNIVDNDEMLKKRIECIESYYKELSNYKEHCSSS